MCLLIIYLEPVSNMTLLKQIWRTLEEEVGAAHVGLLCRPKHTKVFENMVWIRKSLESFLTKGTSSLVCALVTNN